MDTPTPPQGATPVEPDTPVDPDTAVPAPPGAAPEVPQGVARHCRWGAAGSRAGLHAWVADALNPSSDRLLGVGPHANARGCCMQAQ